MPIATHVLNGDFSGLVGEVSSIRATINTNSTDGGWVNDVDNVIVLGGTVLAVGADGKFTVTLPTSTGTGLQYQVTAEFTDGSRERKTWDSGWFSLAAAGDLADLANDSSLRVTATLGDQLAARIDGYQDHGDVSGVLTVDPAVGTHVLAATGSLLVTLDTAPDGRIVTLYVVSGASNVTVDGISGLTLTDGSFASFVHVRGAWVLASAGGAAGPTDTTPPSAPTGLTATGSAGELTFSFAPGTDADSTVTHRYEVYTGTSAGTSTLVTANPMTVTGLTAGTYTVRLFARSDGGNSAVVTTTATVTNPPGWSVWDSINFATQTAGTYATPKDFTTTGGRTLRAVSATGDPTDVVIAGKIKGVYQQLAVGLEFPTALPAQAMRVSAEMEMVGTNASYGPRVSWAQTMQTGAVHVALEFNWSTGNSYRIAVYPDYGTGHVLTPGPGYTVSGANIDGIPSSGLLVTEVVGQVLTVTIDGAVIATLDCTNCVYGGSPNPLIGAFQRAEMRHDGAFYDLKLETYS